MKTYPSFSPRGALDRFYYRDLELLRARRCRLALSKVASDHLPIVADLRLRRP
jgi:endonuclease/exonuclease/phosphatase family metal-dependent hydrolase